MNDAQREATLARFTRQRPDARQLATVEKTTDVFRGVAEYVIDTSHPSREQSCALTALEEAKFWANQNVVLNGVPLPAPDPAPKNPLSFEFNDGGDTDATTVGEYLAELLITLLQEEEGFDPKRPFGNSGWASDLYEALGADYGFDGNSLDPLFIAIRKALS